MYMVSVTLEWPICYLNKIFGNQGFIKGVRIFFFCVFVLRTIRTVRWKVTTKWGIRDNFCSLAEIIHSLGIAAIVHQI